MTNTARGNVTLRGFRSRAVVLITGNMRVKSCRNRHGQAAATGPMTSCATNPAHSHVTRVVESHVEAAEPRKWFQSSRLRVAVANRAYRIRRITKLLYMTASARQVFRASRDRRARRIGLPSMTKQAWQASVIGRCVLKPRLVPFFQKMPTVQKPRLNQRRCTRSADKTLSAHQPWTTRELLDALCPAVSFKTDQGFFSTCIAATCVSGTTSLPKLM